MVETPFVDNGVAKTPTTTYEYDEVGNQTHGHRPAAQRVLRRRTTTAKTVLRPEPPPEPAVTDAAGYTPARRCTTPTAW